MSRIEYSRRAEEDLASIALYIARDNVDAANKLVDQIEAKCRQLVDLPDLGELRPDIAQGQFRSTLVGNYVIYYSTAGSKLYIARILHGARDHDSLL